MAIFAQGQARLQAGAVDAHRRQRRRFPLQPYLFILPHLILFGVFVAYPFISGLYISFLHYDYLRPDLTQFVGLQNYSDLFNPSFVEYHAFWTSLGNTALFVVYSVPPLVIIPLGLALLLNNKLPGISLFRAIYFAPWVLSVSVVGIIWFWIFQTNGGLVNTYLASWHLTPQNWLSTLPWGWIAILIATIWWTMGFNMIITLAALQDIPQELHDAAAVDGANTWQRFWHITLPLLKPVLLFIVTITIIASFNLFGQPLLMTRGGPPDPRGGGGTTTVMMEIYNQGFVNNFEGSAAAMSFIVAALMLIVTFTNFRVFRSRS